MTAETQDDTAMSDQGSVEQEMVRLISNQARRVPLPVLIALIVMSLIASKPLPLWVVGLWFVCATTVMISRYVTLKALPEALDLTPKERLRKVIKLNLISGLTHTLALGAFPFFTEAERAFFSVLLMGLCTGSVATCAGYKPALLAYASPIMLGLSLMWAVGPGVVQIDLVERVIGVLLLFYLAVLLGLARELNRGIVDAWDIRMRERQLNLRLQKALESAENASRAKTRFLAAASHDLRQPLHTITMLGAALGLRPADARGKEIVNLLNEVTQSFSDQLDGLLDISKLDAGVIKVDTKAICIADVVSHHMAEIEGLILAKQLIPTLDCTSRDYVATDPLLFLRVVSNLTHNAIKFTSTGSVGIAVRSAGAHVEVVISDTGSGIPQAQHDQVFQEFYQVDNPERDRTQGLGLGLSIVKRLVELLGIEMQMHSSPSIGTRFVLRLEKIPAPTAHLAAPPPEILDPHFNLSVLLIDDEKTVRTSLRILLEELGCTCLEATGTTQAVQQVKHQRPDLILADFRLRGSDSGLLAIAAVHERWPGVAAVLVSGDTAPSRLQEAQYAGIKLLHKPVPPDALRRELAAAKQSQQVL